MTTPNIKELINNLTIKAGVMEMGEKIAWGSDTALMRQAAATLQSQAERIKVLELDLDVQAGSIEAVQAVNTRQAERIEALEEEIDNVKSVEFPRRLDKVTKPLIAERDTLRAQLAGIEANEPVAWLHTGRMGGTQAFTNEPPPRLKTECQPLFTRPMPADVTELVDALEGQLDDATAAARSGQMIAETAQAAAARLLTERDELRAQLAEIENVEPVIWAISYDGVTPYTLWHEGDGSLLDCEVKRQGGTTQKMPLFTAAPAPQTEEPVATDNMNHPLRTWKDPLSAWWHCRSNWGIGGIGLSEAEAITNWADENPKEVMRLGLFTRTMPVQPIIGLQAIHDAITVDPTLADCSQDMNAELVEALEKLARLGNGDRYGNSDGNMIAREALSKYKGAK